MANPNAPNARPGHTASPNDSLPAPLSEFRDAGAELVVEAVPMPAVTSVAVVGDDTAAPLPEADITLVTVDRCDAVPPDDGGTVVRNVEVIGLAELTAPPALAPVDDGVGEAVVESAVPFCVADGEGEALTGSTSTVEEGEVVLLFEALELTHEIEPTCTVLVLSSDGLLLVKGRPALPVPLA